MELSRQTGQLMQVIFYTLLSKRMNRDLAIVYNIVLLLFTLVAINIEMLRVIIPFMFLGNLITLVRHQKKLVSVGLILFSLLTLFHCAKYTSLTDVTFDDVDYVIEIKALKFSISCILCFIIGYYIKRTNNRDFSSLFIDIPDSYIQILRKVAFYMFIITLIPAVYFDVQSIKATLLYGYGALYHLSDSDYLIKYGYIITPFFKHSILLLLLSYVKDGGKALIILVLAAVYLFLSMLSGARINALIYIILYSFVYIKLYIRKISLREILVIGSIVLAITVVIPVISNIRGAGDMSLSTILEASSAIHSDKGSVSSIAEEFGDSQITLIYTMMFTNSFNYGLTYPLSFLQITPKLPSSWMPFLANQFMYTESLPATYKATLGGSCIGEAYYNFGWFGIFFFLFVGMFVKKLDSNICICKKDNFIKFLLYISILPGLVMWVRGAFYQIIYVAFWTPIIYKIVIYRHAKKVKG